jgi:hypothetical protein
VDCDFEVVFSVVAAAVVDEGELELDTIADVGMAAEDDKFIGVDSFMEMEA